MAKLIFKNDKNDTLAKMMKWAEAHKRRIPYGQGGTKESGLWLVKDEGIYLMSPTEEKFVNDKKSVNTVVYASGYKPTKTNQDTLWDKTHDVSGDDFAEFIGLNDIQKRRVLEGCEIEINWGKKQYSVGV
jgi:hypothetical protein|tara:strand:+ start:165 stop:554 length:390 start_codon:yes stop_codon:yes gene_type:complete